MASPFTQPTAVELGNDGILYLSSVGSQGRLLGFDVTRSSAPDSAAGTVWPGFGLVRRLHIGENGAFTLLNSRDGALVIREGLAAAPRRFIPLPEHAWDFLPIDDGLYLVNANVRTPELVGLPLHVVSEDGTVHASFGEIEDELVYRWDIPFAGQKILVSDPGGGVWAADVNEYRIDLWSLEGVHLRRIAPNREWYRPIQPGTRTLFDPESPPPSRVRDLRVRGDTLWVLINVPADNWSDVCATCDWDCEEAGHKDKIDWHGSNPLNVTLDPHPECVPLLCSDHPPCWGTGPPDMAPEGIASINHLLQELQSALLAPTDEPLVQLLASTDQIIANRERRALQLLDCQGEVSLHVAVAPDFQFPAID